MSSGAFGAPVPGGGPAVDEQNPNGQVTPSEEVQEIVDPNDPRLVSEDLNVNVERDAYALPPLPPDGKWRAKLKLEGIKDPKTNEVSNYHAVMTKRAPFVPYFETRISASILDPTGRFDGVTLYASYGSTAGTLVQRDGSSKVTTILSKILRPDGTTWAKPGLRMNQKDWMELFIKALLGEPELGIETRWEWQCRSCSDEAKVTKKYPNPIEGMHRFPAESDKAKRAAGELFSPEMKCQVSQLHGFSRAQARIARFLSLAEIGK